MTSLKLLGKLYQTDDGEIVFLPSSNLVSIKQPQTLNGKKSGKIVKSPTPGESRIAKEKKVDYSLEGRLKKHVSKEKLQE
jgi:hypothetical protein